MTKKKTVLEKSSGKRAVSVQFDAEDYRDLLKEAKAEDRSVAGLVRLYVTARLAAERVARTARPVAQ
jgi:hypothetical protein